MTDSRTDEVTPPDDDYLARTLGSPGEWARRKLSPVLHQWAIQFIGLSPFVVIASSDREGRVTASPRGGAPGFVRVLDERTLVVPDRSGNRLFPGVEETSRVNGSARVVLAEDPEWATLEPCLLAEEPYIAALVVNVREVYYHCGRAPRFGGLWDVETIERHRADRPIPKRPGRS
jgi:predicted pyridoxine 5'-phosphate oxidase superfamily flavin-nucleotide-binding protein